MLYTRRKQLCESLIKVVSEEISDHEKCIKQLALNVVQNAKFHSNLPQGRMFFAKNATEKERNISSLIQTSLCFLSIFVFYIKLESLIPLCKVDISKKGVYN